MWRTLFTPKWLALLAVLVAILVVFAQLGLWQLAVARDDAIDRAAAQRAAQQPEPVQELISPYQRWSEENTLRAVQASGEYVPDEQFLVPARLLEGESGLWVVTPLLVEGSQARLAVVRGFISDASQAQPPPTGSILVTGALAPGESPNPQPGLPPGQLGSIDLAALVNVWPAPVYNAFVFAQDEQDAAGQAVAEHPTRVPPPRIGGEVDWRNLGYAMQWWVFAGFAVFMFWRLLRDEHRGATLQVGPGDGPTVDAGAEGTGSTVGSPASAEPEEVTRPHV